MGWNDYGARNYDALLGRWMQSDPLGELAVNWTSYRYGFNNPIMLTDVDGLFEDRGAAKKYAKDNGIKTGWFRDHQIVSQPDGTYSIDNRKEEISIFNDPDFGISRAAIVSTNRKDFVREYDGLIDRTDKLLDAAGFGNDLNAMVITGAAKLGKATAAAAPVIEFLGKVSNNIGKLGIATATYDLYKAGPSTGNLLKLGYEVLLLSAKLTPTTAIAVGVIDGILTVSGAKENIVRWIDSDYEDHKSGRCGERHSHGSR